LHTLTSLAVVQLRAERLLMAEPTGDGGNRSSGAETADTSVQLRALSQDQRNNIGAAWPSGVPEAASQPMPVAYLPSLDLNTMPGAAQHVDLARSACTRYQHEHVGDSLASRRPSARGVMASADDPLMHSMEDPNPRSHGTLPGCHFFSGGFPFIKSSVGGSLLQRDVLGQQRGPVASPNVVARPLDPSRQRVYPMFSDTLVEPLRPRFMDMPTIVGLAQTQQASHPTLATAPHAAEAGVAYCGHCVAAFLLALPSCSSI
jgi:hypothetical protein